MVELIISYVIVSVKVNLIKLMPMLLPTCVISCSLLTVSYVTLSNYMLTLTVGFKVTLTPM